MKRILDKVFSQSPWLVFLPFGLIWAVMAIAMKDNSALVYDEVRYWGFATNLLNGHFHFYEGDNFLWSGPGYPIFLTPFVALDSPLWLIKFFNAVMLYMTVVILYKCFREYFSAKRAFVPALAFAMYYPLYFMALPNIMTEALTLLCLATAMLAVSRAMKRGHHSWKQLIWPGFCLAFMTLTKIIFGYVVMALVLAMALAWLRNREKTKFKSLLRINLLALAFLLPYLCYTFVLTKKPLYWSNSGGLSLYWMSSPFSDELGDWHASSLREHPSLKRNHGQFFDSIAHLGPVEKDEALKSKAIENIKAHPQKFLYNCLANIGRTLFSHPLSHLRPSNGFMFYLVPNIFFLVLTLLFLLPTIFYHRKFPAEILMFLFMAFLYLSETIIVSSYTRFFFMIVPILLLWIFFFLDRFVKIDFQIQKKLSD